MEQTKKVDLLKRRLSGRFLQARTALGLSLHQVQNEGVIGINVIHKIETECVASLDAFFALACYYQEQGINLDWLLNFNDDDPINKPILISDREKRLKISEIRETERLEIVQRFLEEMNKNKTGQQD